MNVLFLLKHSGIVVAAILAVAGCAAAPLEATSTCKPGTLDESAGVNFAMGLPYYVYPRTIVKLNGCQTMWDSKGRITMQIVFRDGNAVQYLEYADTGVERLSCKYAEDIARAPTCPDKQDIATGFKVLSADIEKSLPKFDDLRQQKKQ
jgi:hypothetical protein